MKNNLKTIICFFLTVLLYSHSYAQIEKILAQFPEPQDISNIPYEERAGWGLSTGKDGTKTYMLYDASYNKYNPKNSKYLFGITIYPDKSFFIANYEYAESRQGALVSTDGSSALTGIFYDKKKPKYFPSTCSNSGSKSSLQFIANGSHTISAIINEKEIYIGEMYDGKYSGEGILIKNGNLIRGTWKMGEEVSSLVFAFDGKYQGNAGKKAKRSYSMSTDSQFTGTATETDQCITFVFKQSSLSLTGNASVDYYYVFITVNEAVGKEKNKIVAAAREYVTTEMSISSDYDEYQVFYDGTECSEVKSKLLSGNSSIKFIVYRINFSRYDPDRN